MSTDRKHALLLQPRSWKDSIKSRALEPPLPRVTGASHWLGVWCLAEVFLSYRCSDPPKFLEEKFTASHLRHLRYGKHTTTSAINRQPRNGSRTKDKAPSHGGQADALHFW